MTDRNGAVDPGPITAKSLMRARLNRKYVNKMKKLAEAGDEKAAAVVAEAVEKKDGKRVADEVRAKRAQEAEAARLRAEREQAEAEAAESTRLKAEENAAREKAEAEAAEAERMKAEEEAATARRKAEEDAALGKAEAGESARLATEAEAARVKAEETAARGKTEAVAAETSRLKAGEEATREKSEAEEAARVAAEAEAAREKAEEDAVQAMEEAEAAEAARVQAEDAAARGRAMAEEAARVAAEAEAEADRLKGKEHAAKEKATVDIATAERLKVEEDAAAATAHDRAQEAANQVHEAKMAGGTAMILLVLEKITQARLLSAVFGLIDNFCDECAASDDEEESRVNLTPEEKAARQAALQESMLQESMGSPFDDEPLDAALAELVTDLDTITEEPADAAQADIAAAASAARKAAWKASSVGELTPYRQSLAQRSLSRQSSNEGLTSKGGARLSRQSSNEGLTPKGVARRVSWADEAPSQEEWKKSEAKMKREISNLKEELLDAQQSQFALLQQEGNNGKRCAKKRIQLEKAMTDGTEAPVPEVDEDEDEDEDAEVMFLKAEVREMQMRYRTLPKGLDKDELREEIEATEEILDERVASITAKKLISMPQSPERDKLVRENFGITDESTNVDKLKAVLRGSLAETDNLHRQVSCLEAQVATSQRQVELGTQLREEMALMNSEISRNQQRSLTNMGRHTQALDGMGSLEDLISTTSDERMKKLLLNQVQELSQMLREMNCEWAR